MVVSNWSKIASLNLELLTVMQLSYRRSLGTAVPGYLHTSPAILQGGYWFRDKNRILKPQCNLAVQSLLIVRFCTVLYLQSWLCSYNRWLKCVVVSITVIENADWIVLSIFLAIFCYDPRAIRAACIHVHGDGHPAMQHFSVLTDHNEQKAALSTDKLAANLRTWEHMNSSGSPPQAWGFLICLT